MKTFALTLAVTLVISYAGNAIGQNSRAYTQARDSLAKINALVKDGPTDSDTAEIDRLMGSLPSLRRALTPAQQSELWARYPYFAGIACNWAVGHDFHGNDCQFQCEAFKSV